MRVNVPKNKHGPSYVEFYLAVNRATQTLTDAASPEAAANAGTNDPAFIKRCAAVHQIIIDHATAEKPLGEKDLRGYVTAENLKIGKDGLAGIVKRLTTLGKVGFKYKKPETEWGPLVWPIIMTVEEPEPAVNNGAVNGAHADDISADNFISEGP